MDETEIKSNCSLRLWSATKMENLGCSFSKIKNRDEGGTKIEVSKDDHFWYLGSIIIKNGRLTRMLSI